jgi:Domain of unknown function (DUF4148)
MNRKTLPIAAALGLSFAFGVAQAEPGDFDSLAGFVSTKSRAEVVAETVAARAAGTIRYGESASDPASTFVSTKSRAEVRAELREAQRLGLVGSRGDAEQRTATPAQAEQIRQAGLRAAADLSTRG